MTGMFSDRQEGWVWEIWRGWFESREGAGQGR